MKVLLDDKELINGILEFDKAGNTDVTCIFSSVEIEENIKVIQIDIWKTELNRTEIVVSAIKNSSGISVLGNQKVFIVCSFDMEEEAQAIKDEGRRLKSMLLRNLKNKGIRITSNLHYKG